MEISEIKEQLSIHQVLAHYNLEPNKNKMLCCPFHEDQTPSMQVYPESNTVFCFSGNCTQTGKAIDQIDFILHKENISKHEAILKAKSLLGHTAKPKQQPTSMKETFKKLQQALAGSKKAVTYLESRNLHDVKLEIGFKPSYGGSKLFPGMSDCLIFPLKNHKDEMVSFYGRSINGNKKQRHYYQKDRKGLYPNYPHAMGTYLVLTESVIDAATITRYTDYQVLALYGTNGLTPEHRQCLSQLKELREIILFFDGDEAGANAARKYSKELQGLLPEVSISKVNTPEGEDPNSLVQSHEPEILTHLIEQRTYLYQASEKPLLVADPVTQTSKLDTTNPELFAYSSGILLITVLGGIALHPVDKLKVTLKIARTDNASPLYSIRHSLDLYHDDQSEKLIRKAAERLETGSREMQLAIAGLTQELEIYRIKQIQEQKPKKPEKRALTATRKSKVIKFLETPKLLERTNELIGKSGVVGEQNNRLLMYLVFTSRLRDQPLHIISLGASGTGKTYLQEKIAELIPQEDKLEITALSENALYYFDRTELKHKLILIEDLDGASDDKVLFAIRELQSKKRISKTLPIKDSKGNLKTITLQVEGPISLAGTTTREKLYEDNANRSLLIYLDNSQAHKEAIMDYQRALSAGVVNKKEETAIKEFFKDVQSVLKPIQVRNPYATKLIIPETVFKPLRSNTHYLSFIEVITFYKQYQREVKTDSQTGEKYIETSLEDIEEANALLKDVLLAKSDELTKGCRDFFERLKAYLKQENTTAFYSQQVRLPLRMSPNNLKYYLAILVKYHLVKIIGGHPRKKGYEYEIESMEEYEKLQNKLTNALDTALAKLKAG